MRTAVVMASVLACGVAEAAAPPAARVDFLGDPLPRGAVARFGTTRLSIQDSFGSGFSEDSREAFVSAAGERRYWDAKTGKPTRRVVISGGGVWSSLSADGKRAAGVRDGVPSVCDVTSGRVLRSFPSGAADVREIALSRDGKSVVLGDKSGAVRVYEVDGDGEPKRLEKHRLPVFGLAYSPDGRWLAAGEQTDEYDLERALKFDNVLRVWDARSGKLAREFTGFKARSGNFVWLADGKRLAVKDWTDLRVFDVTTGKQERGIGPKAKGSDFLAISPDGRRLVMRSPSRDALELWDRSADERLRSVRLGGLTNAIFVFSPDGKSLVALLGSGPHRARVFDAASLKLWPLAPVPVPDVVSMDVSPDGRALATGDEDGVVRLWDFATGKLLREVKGHDGVVYALRFSPDGGHLVTKSVGLARRLFDPPQVRPEVDESARVWRVSDGEQLRRVASPGYGLDFFPDGKSFALNRLVPKEELFLHRLPDCHEARFETRPRLRSFGFFISPDGALLASAAESSGGKGGGGTLVFDVRTGKLVKAFEREGHSLGPCGFSPDGRWLALGSDTGHVLLVNAKTWQEEGSIPVAVRRLSALEMQILQRNGGTPRFNVGRLRFSPDGRLVAVPKAGSERRAVAVWEVDSGAEVLAVSGHMGAISDFRFAPDGRLVTASGDVPDYFGKADATALVWDPVELSPPLPGDGLPGEAAMNECWEAMARPDAAGFLAGLSLCRRPAEAVAFLTERLRPEPKRDEERIARLVAALDDEDRAGRDRASRGLSELGTAAEAELREAERKPASLEVRKRARALLDGIAPGKRSGRELRAVRAVGVLRRIGTAEAKALLRRLSEGEPAVATQAARAALDRP